MKRSLLLFMLLCFVVFSCNKEGLNGTLSGTWRMILVTDNTTGAEAIKPASVEGEVEITFSETTAIAGTFTGHTTRNDFFGSFTTGNKNDLSVDELNMTKIAETSWGDDFIDNFRAAQSYSFTSVDKLTIKSAEKTLTFKRE